MKKYERFLLLGGLVAAVLCVILLSPPVFAQDNTNKPVLDSATVANGEPECVHPARYEDSVEVEDSAVVAAAMVEEEPPPLPARRRTPPGVSDFLFVPKYFTFGAIMLLGLILLFGRWINKWVRIGVMALSFFLFGVGLVYPLHPSPMCGLTKLIMFRFTWGQWFPAFIAIVLAMLVPSLIGRKLFCGWVCPLGAMQELINKIPFPKKFKNFNFTAFNTLRFGLLVMFFMTFFWVMDHILYLAEQVGADPTGDTWVAFSSYSIYDSINMFHLLHWEYTDAYFIAGFIILFVASLMLYRPFCYLVCPIGAITWLLEKIAPGRIRIDHDACTECGACMEASPCPTIKPLVEQNMKVLPDCTSCGECVRACPEDAIKFGFKK
ncbi:MAG TPA: 4Fe-4S binding protein [candidate division Zixibacteria bacterium]|nr:4Fe-4S binding protein [candidate division Zixibacteria bacterium]